MEHQRSMLWGTSNGDQMKKPVSFNSDDFMSFNGRNRTEENYVFQMDLKTFISKLKDIEKKIFRLKNFGMTFREIATKVQMSVSKVFSILQDVKEKFIKYFQLQHASA